MKASSIIIIVILLAVLQSQCTKRLTPTTPVTETTYEWNKFVMGSDASYTNQIEDNGGIYKINNTPIDPFSVLKQIGCNTIRVRLWYNPSWVLPLSNGKYYSDLYDAEKTIRRAKQQGMSVNLCIHYSDDWADPDKQNTPTAWQGLGISALKDSVYQYTLRTLVYLNSKNLTPEMIQIGNETTNGMLWPTGKITNNTNWNNFGILINSGIKAVRDFSVNATIKPQIIIHVAQFQYANWFATSLTTKAAVTDFDILGVSHYYKWSTINTMQAIGDSIKVLKNKFNKKIMIVETAFPFTNDNADSYNNLFYSTTSIDKYTVSKEGQQQYLIDLTQTIISNGGSGIMYWEPTWITSKMNDRWGIGSSWENNAFFDFSGNLLPTITFMKYPYQF
jgi:arabinogalactan endo-1,4-beta-galactosidase